MANEYVIDESIVPIRILDGLFSGVVFAFTEISLDFEKYDETQSIPANYNYTIIRSGNSLNSETRVAFEAIVSQIFLQVITTEIEKIKNGKNNPEEFDSE